MSTERPEALRNPAAIYVTGLFSMGYIDFYIFLMPLYGLSLGMSAGEIGMLVGARSVAGGVSVDPCRLLMDRFGTRRVTLFFVWTAIALAPVFPLVPWFWPLLLLQIVNGGALVLCLVGVADPDRPARRGRGRVYRPVQLFRADRHRGRADHRRRRLGFRRRLAGLYDRRRLGRGADSGAVARARGGDRAARRQAAPRRRGSALRDALPRLSDYIACFALMAIPAVAATMAIIFLRTATNGVQFSLYVVYLDGIGLTGTSIGILFAGDRDRERLRLAVRRAGDAARRPAARRC